MSMPEESIHPETLEERPPEYIAYVYHEIIYILSSYGWHLIALSLLALYLWNRFQQRIQNWRSQYDQSKFAAECKKNPDLLQARQEAIEKARRKMQEEHDKQAVIHAERKKELEERKTLEKLQRAVGSEGYRLDDGSGPSSEPGSSKKTSAFKPEYNPLMGAGSSGGYRPPKRGCPGGGCGKK